MKRNLWIAVFMLISGLAYPVEEYGNYHYDESSGIMFTNSVSGENGAMALWAQRQRLRRSSNRDKQGYMAHPVVVFNFPGKWMSGSENYKSVIDITGGVRAEQIERMYVHYGEDKVLLGELDEDRHAIFVSLETSQDFIAFCKKETTIEIMVSSLTESNMDGSADFKASFSLVGFTRAYAEATVGWDVYEKKWN
jgi:hypothetical protein